MIVFICKINLADILRGKLDVSVCFINVYESGEIGGERCFTIEGDIPAPIDKNILCTLRPLGSAPRFLAIEGAWSPDIEGSIKVRYDGGLVKFKVTESQGKKMLETDGITINFSDVKKSYNLIESQNNELYMEEIHEG